MKTKEPLIQEQKGLLVWIYRNETMDCTNGGLTGKPRGFTRAILIGPGVEEVTAPNEYTPALYLRNKTGYVHAIPERPTINGDTDQWFMFGGNFIYSSDGRFAALNHGAPIAVHDRTESAESMRMVD